MLENQAKQLLDKQLEKKLKNYFEWVRLVWVNSRGHRLNFDDRAYLVQIYEDQFPSIVYMKAAQMGLSERSLSEAVWLPEQLGMNVLYCVDEETELLSEKGWVKYNDVAIGDDIFTINQHTGMSEWSTVEEVFIKKVDTQMVSLKTNKFDALVTPNHRWLLYDKGRLVFKETEQLHDRANLFIPRAVEKKDLDKEIFSDDFVKLCAWVWTDGHFQKSQSKKGALRATRIGITQSLKVNEKKVTEIRRLVKSVAGDYKEYLSNNGCIQIYFNGQVASKIRELFPNKVPSMHFLRGLSNSQLQMFIHHSLLADGYFGRDKNSKPTREFYQHSDARVDAFMTACAMAGINTKKVKRKYGGYQLRLYKAKRSQSSKLHKEYVDYSGTVWCPRTVNGTFLARRNGIMYWTGNTFPASSQLQDFTQARLDPVFQHSKYLQEVYQTASDGVQKIELKKIGKGHIYFRGSQNEKQIISIDADAIFLDERDRFLPASVPFIDKRTLASSLRWRRELSTPTKPGFGIHAAYLESDQRVWQVCCPKCGLWQEINFFKNIDHKTFEIHCAKEDCDGQLERLSPGRWHALRPEKSNECHGYKVSGLYNPRRSVKEIVDDYYKALNNSISDLEQFYNQTLGEPFSVDGQKLSPEDIDGCKADYSMPVQIKGCYAGADVGSVINMVVSYPYSNGKARIVWTGTVNHFFGPSDSVESVIEKFDIKLLVIDKFPEQRKVAELVEKFPGRVYAATYPTKNFTIDQYIMWDDVVKEVKLDRTISLDYLVNDIQNKKTELPANISMVDNFYEQMCSSVRITIKNERTGAVLAKWVEEKADHYFHAANYDRIARTKAHVGQALVDYYKSPEKKASTLNDIVKWINLNGQRVF